MKNNEKLIESLKQEYLELMEKKAKLEIAIITFLLDEEEGDMMRRQATTMNEHANCILSRIRYAVWKEAQK